MNNLRNNLFIILIVLSVVNFLGLSFLSRYSSWFYFGQGFVLFILGRLFGLTKSDVQKFMGLYILIVLSTLLIYFSNIFTFGNSYFIGGSDDKDYEIYANLILEHDDYNPVNINSDLAAENKELGLFGHNSPRYIYIVSRLICFFGPQNFHTIIPRLFNGFLLVLSGIFIYFIVGCLGLKLEHSKKMFPSLIYVLNPVNIYISGHVFRDSLISLLIVTSIWAALRYKSNVFVKVTLFSALMYFMLGLRASYLVPMLLLLCLSFFKKVKFVIVVFATVGLLFLNTDYVKELLNLISLYGADLSNNRGNEQGVTSIIFNSSWSIQVVLRILYSLITPYFLLPTNMPLVFLFFGTLLNVIFMPLSVLGFIKSGKFTYKTHIAIYAGLLFSGYVFGTFMFRHIPVFWWFIAIFGTYGFFSLSSRSFGIFKLYIASVFLLFVILNLVHFY